MESIYTLGHSTRTIDEFIKLLREHSLEMLVDVRRFPGSRRHPQFNKGNLERSLEDAQIRYKHLEELGGRRGEPAPDSPNNGWKVNGFRPYADHINTAEGRAAIENLLKFLAEHRSAIMCAESLPWKCHRQIIADVLVARGIDVYHIIDHGRTEVHTLNPMEKLMPDKTVIYPSSKNQETLFKHKK